VYQFLKNSESEYSYNAADVIGVDATTLITGDGEEMLVEDYIILNDIVGKDADYVLNTYKKVTILNTLKLYNISTKIHKNATLADRVNELLEQIKQE
jgi:hypothetical protein